MNFHSHFYKVIETPYVFYFFNINNYAVSGICCPHCFKKKKSLQVKFRSLFSKQLLLEFADNQRILNLSESSQRENLHC